MISNDLKSNHEKEFKDEYYTPEYITISVTEPISHEENGKKAYTSYKITTQVNEKKKFNLYFYLTFIKQIY